MGRLPKKQHVHSEALLECARTLLKSGHLVDTSVIVGDKTFKAHGLVLAAYSGYLKGVMTSENREMISKVVSLDDLKLTPTAFEVILDYMYNGVLNVIDQDLDHVEYAAAKLQVGIILK